MKSKSPEISKIAIFYFLKYRNIPKMLEYYSSLKQSGYAHCDVIIKSIFSQLDITDFQYRNYTENLINIALDDLEVLKDIARRFSNNSDYKNLFYTLKLFTAFKSQKGSLGSDSISFVEEVCKIDDSCLPSYRCNANFSAGNSIFAKDQIIKCTLSNDWKLFLVLDGKVTDTVIFEYNVTKL